MGHGDGDLARPNGNLKVDVRGRYSNSWEDLVAQLQSLIHDAGLPHELGALAIDASRNIDVGASPMIAMRMMGSFLDPSVTRR